VCVGVGVDEYFKCVLDSVHICVMRVDVCVLYGFFSVGLDSVRSFFSQLGAEALGTEP
jgi:hypothetical protein